MFLEGSDKDFPSLKHSTLKLTMLLVCFYCKSIRNPFTWCKAFSETFLRLHFPVSKKNTKKSKQGKLRTLINFSPLTENKKLCLSSHWFILEKNEYHARKNHISCKILLKLAQQFPQQHYQDVLWKYLLCSSGIDAN